MAARGKNPMLAKIQARHEAEKRSLRLFTLQWAADMMCIAANEVLGLGADRLAKLEEAYWEASRHYAEKTLEDAAWDKTIDYTKGDLDRKMEAIMGDHFRPWEERYGH